MAATHLTLSDVRCLIQAGAVPRAITAPACICCMRFAAMMADRMMCFPPQIPRARCTHTSRPMMHRAFSGLWSAAIRRSTAPSVGQAQWLRRTEPYGPSMLMRTTLNAQRMSRGLRAIRIAIASCCTSQSIRDTLGKGKTLLRVLGVIAMHGWRFRRTEASLELAFTTHPTRTLCLGASMERFSIPGRSPSWSRWMKTIP